FFDISDGQGGKVCFCQPKDTGDSQPGAACPFGDVNKDADFCVAEATCLGIEPATDTTACATPDDCKGVFPGATVCIDGHCGTSFCSVPCGEGDTCEPGFDPIQVGQEPDVACFCAPREVGTSGPGDACPFGTVNAEAEACDAQTWCLGMPADAESAACANDEDCPETVFAGNPDCVDGHCGTSFCAPKCTDGKCEPGFQPIDIDGACLCQPRVVGTAVAGDPCPFANVNLDAEACNLDTSCLGIPAAAGTPACVAPTDCPKVDAEGNDLLGTPDCTDGHCGYSFCAAECDAEGACLAGFHPIDVDGTCYCAPGEAAPAEPQPDAAVTPDEPVTADDPTAPDAAVTPDVPAVEDVPANPDAPIDTPARGIDTP
ncbi:MAG: hypothetical protein FJ087_09430, partial [Deltaproteobacteria bacterium]|nr:hypothetical protein [Deltaproteobacteria bacterium]